MKRRVVISFVFALVTGLMIGTSGMGENSGSFWSKHVRPHFFAIVAKWSKKPDQSPTQAIKNMDSLLNDYKTGSNLTPEEKKQNRDIKNQVIHSTFDIRELCMLSLGRHWKEIDTGEQNAFVELMINLLEEKAVLSKEQGKKRAKNTSVYTLSYFGDEYLNKEKTKAYTKTKVYVKSEDISVGLDYRLLWKSGTWKVFDVIVDGASLVENYKYQFDSIIKKHGFDDLLGRMQKKLDELRQKGGGE